jgi:hypothetical protein
MLAEFPRRARARDWFIRITEVSAGVYVVVARDRWGREVSHTGTPGTDAELDRLLEDVERSAEAVDRQWFV